MPKRVQLPAVLGAGEVPTQSILWNCVSDLFSNAMKPEVGFAGAVALVNPVIAGPVIGLAVLCGVCRYMSRRRSEAEDKALHEQIKLFAEYAAEGRDVLADIADGTIALNVEIDDLVKMDIAEFVDRQLGSSESELRQGLNEEFERVLSMHPKLEALSDGVELLQVLAWTADARGRRMESLALTAEARGARMETVVLEMHAMLLRERSKTAESVTSERSAEDSVTLEFALRSRDPSTRRVALLVNRELKKARAAHELAKTQHADRPSDDARVRARDLFLDTMFEADLLRTEGKWHQAMPLYAKAFELDPDDVLAAVSLIEAEGWYIWVAKASDPATVADDDRVPVSEKALELLRTHIFEEHDAGSPTLLPASWALARYCYEVAQHTGSKLHSDLSLRALERAEEGGPDNPVTLRLLARHWWVRERDAAKAEPYFKRSIEELPEDDTSSRFTYAWFLVENDRGTDAIPYFESCLDIDPDNPDALCAYADLLSQNPDTQEQAERMWRHALTVRPDHAGAWLSLARQLSADPSRIAEAEAVFKSALSERSGDADISAAYAMFLDELPDRDLDTRNAYLRVCELRPHSVEAKVRARMHALAIGWVANPESAGISTFNEGIGDDNNRQLLIAGSWIGVLFGPKDEQRSAVGALKALLTKEPPPPPLPFLWYPKCVSAVRASGHQFAEWLEPLSLSLASGQVLESLSEWDVWQEIPSG